MARQKVKVLEVENKLSFLPSGMNLSRNHDDLGSADPSSMQDACHI